MASRARRSITTLAAVLFAAVPLGFAGSATPTVMAGCPDGETGVIYGCAPFCVPGRQLDTATGLCLPVPPPPAAPNDVATPMV
ncbi:hypothetical protein [Mycobacterium aquaticum]|uniref:Intersectin-EH binding protein Ibp1 n=1 Tax=Mycobacterium aquaticum TaxID=1927124 RepID=A0A1X0A2S9_9MYCO|nr:hypothetical protein [Mycobacterium aquaticum]ORA24377.1 hypothetical protein BST13_34085 [Mycobacterium aquaticum]